MGLKEGGLAHFEARVEPHHDPRLKVEWFCNGAPLKIGSRFRPLFDFGFVALDISPVYPEDSGIYVCKATNEYGHATTSATLECFGKWVSQKCEGQRLSLITYDFILELKMHLSFD